jgi:hypothetical protein
VVVSINQECYLLAGATCSLVQTSASTASYRRRPYIEGDKPLILPVVMRFGSNPLYVSAAEDAEQRHARDKGFVSNICSGGTEERIPLQPLVASEDLNINFGLSQLFRPFAKVGH